MQYEVSRTLGEAPGREAHLVGIGNDPMGIMRRHNGELNGMPGVIEQYVFLFSIAKWPLRLT